MCTKRSHVVALYSSHWWDWRNRYHTIRSAHKTWYVVILLNCTLLLSDSVSFNVLHTYSDNFSDSVQQQQPQLAVVTDQPQVRIHPQPRTFSKDMNNEQLALWLSNHPDLVGTDYQSDIDKLKGGLLNVIVWYGILCLCYCRCQN